MEHDKSETLILKDAKYFNQFSYVFKPRDSIKLKTQFGQLIIILSGYCSLYPLY